MAESTRNVTRIRALYIIQVIFTKLPFQKLSTADYHCHFTRQCYSICKHKGSNNSFRKMTYMTNETLLLFWLPLYKKEIPRSSVLPAKLIFILPAIRRASTVLTVYRYGLYPDHCEFSSHFQTTFLSDIIQCFITTATGWQPNCS